MTSIKPTAAEIQAAYNKTVPDVIQPDLKVLFVGINPGLYTAAIGHHFGRPGNRFWPTLSASGFTPRLYDPSEDQSLLQLGYGITNMVTRATATADELSVEEIIEGGQIVAEKVKAYHPQWVAFVGIQTYRQAFRQPKAQVGRQDNMLHQSQIWLLPNPSGLNAHYTPAKLAEVFHQLKEIVDSS